MQSEVPPTAAAKKAKINAIWEELNAKDSVATTKVGHVRKVSRSSKPAKNVPGWMVNLGLAPVKLPSKAKPSDVEGGKALTSTARATHGELAERDHMGMEPLDGPKAVVQNSAAAKPVDSGTYSKAREVLGIVGGFTGFVESSDAKAEASTRKSQMQASSSSGLDVLLQQINKKQKPNILDRSREDWGVFKEEKGFGEELEAYKKSGDKYLDKVAFLQRADVREYEKERDARLALQSKRQSETVIMD